MTGGKQYWVLGAAILIGGVVWSITRTTISPAPASPNLSPTKEEEVATTSVAVNTPPLARTIPTLTLVKGDTVTSWTFAGAYTGNTERTQAAYADISRFLSLIGSDAVSNMELYVSVANEYMLLGDGKQAFAYLNRAVAEGGETTGLPWHNLGVLMERLGALQTARIAYEKSTLIQPQMKQYQYAYLEFLTKRLPNDVVDIDKGFAAAHVALGDDSDITQLRAEWERP